MSKIPAARNYWSGEGLRLNLLGLSPHALVGFGWSSPTSAILETIRKPVTADSTADEIAEESKKHLAALLLAAVIVLGISTSQVPGARRVLQMPFPLIAGLCALASTVALAMKATTSDEHHMDRKVGLGFGYAGAGVSLIGAIAALL